MVKRRSPTSSPAGKKTRRKTSPSKRERSRSPSSENKKSRAKSPDLMDSLVSSMSGLALHRKKVQDAEKKGTVAAQALLVQARLKELEDTQAPERRANETVEEFRKRRADFMARRATARMKASGGKSRNR